MLSLTGYRPHIILLSDKIVIAFDKFASIFLLLVRSHLPGVVDVYSTSRLRSGLQLTGALTGSTLLSMHMIFSVRCFPLLILSFFTTVINVLGNMVKCFSGDIMIPWPFHFSYLR